VFALILPWTAWRTSQDRNNLPFVTAYRARVYRLIFTAAAAYNLAFGMWAAAWPLAFFDRFELEPPRYPSIWACLGMVIGLYGLGYAYAARRFDRAAPFIAIGLLGKLLGPAGWIMTVKSGEWPVRTLTLIVFNDVIWWVPFSLFLLEGTPIAARVRASAPYACAALNLVAIVVMGAVLRFGTEIVPLVADRVSYISQHPVLWRMGWSLWIAAAASLVSFYAWWGSHLRESRWAIMALCVASTGLVCDLFAESLLIGWLPRDYERVAPVATLLTGAAANGFYTIAGVILTLATDALRGMIRAMAWAVWIAGALLTLSTLAHTPIGIAICTTVVFVLFCPWVVLLGRALQTPHPISNR
jgi:hypothetical protein